MKRLLITLVAFGLMAGAGAAAEIVPSIKANVPFDFTIGNKVMPAGVYIISKEDSAGVISMRSLDQEVYTKFLTNRMYTINTLEEPKLVFKVSGTHHFLGEVWMAGGPSGVSVGKSKAEREMARRSALKSVVLSAR